MMRSNTQESFRKLMRSFANAAHGISYLFNSQKNARIEISITILVLVAGFLFNISFIEWLAVLICIALVLSLEAINTAIEILADKLHPGADHQIGKAKDVAAGAVLISAIVASIIGILIFAPRLLVLFSE